MTCLGNQNVAYPKYPQALDSEYDRRQMAHDTEDSLKCLPNSPCKPSGPACTDIFPDEGLHSKWDSSTLPPFLMMVEKVKVFVVDKRKNVASFWIGISFSL